MAGRNSVRYLKHLYGPPSLSYPPLVRCDGAMVGGPSGRGAFAEEMNGLGISPNRSTLGVLKRLLVEGRLFFFLEGRAVEKSPGAFQARGGGAAAEQPL